MLRPRLWSSSAAEAAVAQATAVDAQPGVVSCSRDETLYAEPKP